MPTAPRRLVEKSGAELTVDQSVDYVHRTCERMGVDVVEEIVMIGRDDENTAGDRLRAWSLLLPYQTAPKKPNPPKEEEHDYVFNVVLPDYRDAVEVTKSKEKPVKGQEINLEIAKFE